MDSQLRVSTVVLVSVVCVCLLVPIDCAAVHNRVSANVPEYYVYVCMCILIQVYMCVYILMCMCVY
jgi:hypothetical protein